MPTTIINLGNHANELSQTGRVEEAGNQYAFIVSQATAEPFAKYYVNKALLGSALINATQGQLNTAFTTLHKIDQTWLDFEDKVLRALLEGYLLAYKCKDLEDALDQIDHTLIDICMYTPVLPEGMRKLIAANWYRNYYIATNGQLSADHLIRVQRLFVEMDVSTIEENHIALPSLNEWKMPVGQPEVIYEAHVPPCTLPALEENFKLG